ncbi:Heme-binding-like protein At3g10130, chloroplastic [Linum perenne]
MAATVQFPLRFPFTAAYVPPSSFSVASVRFRRSITNRTHFRRILNNRPFRVSCRFQSQLENPSNSVVDVDKLVDFLYDDLPHLFDDRGIDKKAYDDGVQFRDPITRYDGINGYLLNIAALKTLFQPKFQLHWVKKVSAFGPYEITTRWTMLMPFVILPWRPELVFTGTSVMGVNPSNGKFSSHVDYWDSVSNNQYFSLEALWDMIQQLRIYKTPEIESPKYEILKRTAFYEVRKYEPFTVAEASGDQLAGSAGFGSVTGYIFGKNTNTEKIPMTTPVFTEAKDSQLSKVAIQVVLPMNKDLSNLPDQIDDTVRLKKVEGGIAAVHKFSGKPTEEIAREKEKLLRSYVVKDGLVPRTGCLLARYNDPGRTWSFIMRNEVLIWLEEFSLD